MLGRPVTRGNAQIGYVPQDRGTIAGLRLTGWDVVASAAIGGRFGFVTLDKATRREIDWALDEVGARDFARRSIGELSGGERQRVLLSQALIGRPRLLLLDEPLISLDPAHQKSVVETARGICDDLKIAILFSAHELNPLVNAIDRVLYLGGGEAVIGAVDEVVNGPVLSRLYGRRSKSCASRIAISSWRATSTSSATRIATTNMPTAMLEYDFMRTAFAASGIAAVLAGTVGFFLVLRGQTFAGHALSHVGFTGATGAVLFGLSPLAGFVGFTFVAGIGMGLFGEKLAERDVAIGMMLSLALGLGLLFLHFYTTGATQAAALLFGNVLGVDPSALLTLALLAVGASWRWRYRPSAHLRFASERISPRRAACRSASSRWRFWRLSGRGRRMRANRGRAAGVHADGRPRRGGAEFFAAADRRSGAGGMPRTCRGLGRIDAGLYTDWPTSFWITALSGIIYLTSLVARFRAR